MVTLVTGPVQSGKSTTLQKLADTYPMAGGFCCPKQIQNGEHIGYLIRSIATAESVPFAVLQTDKPVGWREVDTIGPWSFSETGFAFATSIIRDCWDRNRHPIFVDEIGPLELLDRGFATLFRKLLAGPTDLFAVVRHNLVDQVIEHFHIQQYTRIDVK